MDRERLSRLLEEPGKVAREDLSDLKELTEQFPWFSGAQLLRAIGECNSGDVLADETLKVTAAHLPSRAVLFDLQDISLEQAASQLKGSGLKKEADRPRSRLQVVPAEKEPSIQEPVLPEDPKIEQEVSVVQAEAVEEKEKVAPAEAAARIPIEEQAPISSGASAMKEASPEKVEELPTEAIEPLSIDIPEAVAIIPEPAISDLEVDPTGEVEYVDEEIQEEREVRSASAKADPEKEVADLATPEYPVKAELDRQILEAALASAYDLTWQQEIRTTPADRPKKDPRRVSFGQHPSLPNSDPKTEAPIAPVENEKLDLVRNIGPTSGEMVTISVRSKLKFTDWLSIGTTLLEAGSETPADRKIEPIDPPSTDSLILDRTKTDPPVDVSTLIDRFIEHETPQPSRKAEFFTPQQAAKKSLDDTAGLVSETLAKIYEKQGNFQKAIDAYRKLALKYPEKSAYFAALSRTLEEKSKNQ